MCIRDRGGTVSASAVIGWAAQHYGWDGGFYVMIGGGVLAVLLLFIVMVEEGKHLSLIHI